VEEKLSNDLTDPDQLKELFYTIVFTPKFAKNELPLLQLFFTSNEKIYFKALIVSALTLSLLLNFDTAKFNLLFDIYERQHEELWERALVGIILAILYYDKRLNFYPQILKRFTENENLPENNSEYIQIVILQLIKSKETQQIIKKFEEEILPEIHKINEDILITRERHRQHLVQCSDYLKNFNEKNESEDFDKAAEDLRLATRHLGMIVGKVDVEEILGSIFNDFCIGK
jgi:hypothetical protein